MLIGFIGDLHGRVFHALALVATWQRRAGRRLDLVIQVGDLGAFPDSEFLDLATGRFVAEDPTELDFSRLLRAEGRLAEDLRRVRAQLAGPIHFIRGNHEDTPWLRQLAAAGATGMIAVDPFDLFAYVPDGRVLTVGGQRIAFLGGIETPDPGQRAADPASPAILDRDAYAALSGRGAGAVDILVTHDAPYGISVGFHGQTQGSRMITDLIARLQPAYHLAGHYHHLNGPRRYGRTTYLGLNIVLPPVRRGPERRVQPGCLAILDTDADTLHPVTEPWLVGFDKGFDFGAALR